MHKIHINTLDALYEITLKLEILSYLLNLVQLDSSSAFPNQHLPENDRKSAWDYLLDAQTDAVLKLRELVLSENFAYPEKP